MPVFPAFVLSLSKVIHPLAKPLADTASVILNQYKANQDQYEGRNVFENGVRPPSCRQGMGMSWLGRKRRDAEGT